MLFRVLIIMRIINKVAYEIINTHLIIKFIKMNRITGK